jgi:hypothetical protein
MQRHINRAVNHNCRYLLVQEFTVLHEKYSAQGLVIQAFPCNQASSGPINTFPWCTCACLASKLPLRSHPAAICAEPTRSLRSKSRARMRRSSSLQRSMALRVSRAAAVFLGGCATAHAVIGSMGAGGHRMRAFSSWSKAYLACQVLPGSTTDCCDL